MRRFNFRLQHILNMRSHERKEVEHRLGSVTAECNLLDDQLHGLQARRQAAQKRTDPAVARNVLLELNSRTGYFAWIDQEFSRIKQKRSSLEQKRLSIVAEYHEALQREKVLDNLRERREREYYFDEARREEKDVEDAVIDRYIRGGGINGQKIQ
ncbi:flagellar export protein FliJ [Spirochaeta dissipatitropha]